MITYLLQKVITILHIFLIVLFIIGPFLPGKYLIYYLFLWPATYIHWYFNDDNCMLTEIEYSLDKQYHNGLNEYIFNSKRGFFAVLGNLKYDLLNVNFTYYRTILWIVAFIRAFIYYRKDITKWWEIVRKHFVSQFICDSCRG